ncbi:hypothetical protein D3879_19695 [Pseudomonas cavernicola]|uniref:Uncharacterized protein n=1 Tax=Pseudomonas cavernicola TaxID=2320866 RepID=A0A418XCN5_9PSED|nr:hypothetical protein [Pseudomonas cavernicola]RJG10251.1 hypothetical protein D3879_19695 [Pseudomonas cavernicola]
MSNKQVVKQAMVFSQAELEQRQEVAKERIISGYYQEYSHTGGRWVFPAAAPTESFSNFEAFLDFVGEMAVKGIKRFPHESPWHSPTLWQVTYYKPDKDIAELIEQSNQEVEQAYRQEVEDFNQAQIDLLTEQLFEQEKRKQQKLIEEKEAKQLAAARVEAEKYVKSQLAAGAK